MTAWISADETWRPTRLVSTLAAATCCVCLFCGPSPRKRAPDFVLPDMNGARFYLNAQRGQVVLLNFWSVYCVPCRAEMPLLRDLAKSFDGEKVVVVGVCIDNERHDYVRRLVDRLNIGYPILLDTEEEAAALYNVKELPTTVIIDRRGYERRRSVGFDDSTINAYTKTIHALVSEQTSTDR